MISLVMTTFNGEKYLKEQLESIRDQTLAPDEVVIFDDCSTDNTRRIVQTFIEKNDLSKWKFIINKENKGYSLNFSDAIKAAHGDIIFLADQDDIWFSDKIEKMSQIMNNRPEIELLASNVEPLYMGVDSVSVNFEKFRSTSEVIRIRQTAKWIKPARPGCSMCFRTSLLRHYDALWFRDYPHDCLLWGLAVLNGTAYLYNRSMMNFRRHDTNATSRGAKNSRNRIQSIKKETDIIRNLLQTADIIAPCDKKIIEKQFQVFKKRSACLEKRKFFGILSLLFYIRYYPRKRFWLTDLYYMLTSKRIR